jgi:predicted Rossmann fold nucleotide-binding protein DprA/Smf involved in DNA uptake
MSDLIKEIQALQKEINQKQATLSEKKALLKQQLAEIDLDSLPAVRRGRKTGPKPVKSPKPVKTAKAPKNKRAKSNKRGSQGAAILSVLEGKTLATGEIKSVINYTGANLSAVLAGMQKAGKVEKKDGKWSVKK